jgi:hypothetical protein
MKNFYLLVQATRPKNPEDFRRAAISALLVPAGLFVFFYIAATTHSIITPLVWFFIQVPLLIAIAVGSFHLFVFWRKMQTQLTKAG